MAGELAERQESAPVAVDPERLIATAIAEKIDPAGLQMLLDMRAQLRAELAESAFAAAMRDVQAKTPAIYRDAYNEQTRSRYSKYETVHRTIVPIYTDAGFSLSFGTDDSPLEGHTRYVCDVSHVEGHTRRYQIDLPLDDRGIKGNPNKTALHGAGSASSYARRYLTDMIFNLAHGDQDDDGQAAAGVADEPVNEEQLANLNALLDECGDRGEALSALLKWAKAEALEDVPASKYSGAVRALEARRGQ